MYCKYLTKRIGYLYCKNKKEETTLSQCKLCPLFERNTTNEYKHTQKDKSVLNRSKTPLKQVSKKRAKLEKERYSLFTNDLEHCIEDKRHAGHIDKHEIFNGKNRFKSIKYGLVVPLCRMCHDNKDIQKKWQIIGRKYFIKQYGEEIFIKEFNTKKGI